MTAINNFPKIRFSPTKYSYDLEAKLQHLDILWGLEDEEEIFEIVNQHPDIAECQLALATFYGDLKKPLKYYTTLEKALVSHPNHIAVKAEYARAYYFDYTNKSHREGFEKLFATEIDCLINDKMLPTIISDSELRILLITLNEFFIATNQKENYHKIFRTAVAIEQDELTEMIAFAIRGKDMPFEGIDVDLQVDIETWAAQVFGQLMKHQVNNRPYYDLFYSLLNKPAIEITESDIAKISGLDDNANITHDIIWLLSEGLIRTTKSIGECNQDYFLNGLYVCGHYNLTELNRLFLAFLTGMPEQIVDRILGDIGYEIIGAPLQKLGKTNLDGFLEMFTFTEKDLYDEVDFDEFYDLDDSKIDNNYWYIKSVVLETLGAIAAIDDSKQSQAKLLMRTLWNHYSEHDHEMLGWTMHTITQFHIEGFEQDIEKAFEEDKIDIRIHGDFADYINDKDEDFLYTVHRPFEDYSDVSIYYQYLAQGIEKVSSHVENESADIEEQIDSIIKRAHVKNKQNRLMMKDFEEDNDFILYSNEDEDDDLVQSISEPLRRNQPKIGRNDPCPCGSGKKYKKCCLSKRVDR